MPRVARAALAAVVGLAMIVGGLCGLAHQAEVAHVRDTATGAWVHAAPAVLGHVEGAAAHLHAPARSGDLDLHECALSHSTSAAPAARPSLAIADVARPLVAAPRAIVTAPIVPAVLRVAPKTSPPRA